MIVHSQNNDEGVLWQNYGNYGEILCLRVLNQLYLSFRALCLNTIYGHWSVTYKGGKGQGAYYPLPPPTAFPLEHMHKNTVFLTL